MLKNVQPQQGKGCEGIFESEHWQYLLAFNDDDDGDDDDGDVNSFEMDGVDEKVKHKIARSI